jgi:hypothetical protein
MPRRLMSSGSRFEAEVGYSRAVVDDDWIFVSGTTGFDNATMTIPDDVVIPRWQTLCGSTISCRGVRISSPAGRCSRATSARSGRFKPMIGLGWQTRA